MDHIARADHGVQQRGVTRPTLHELGQITFCTAVFTCEERSCSTGDGSRRCRDSVRRTDTSHHCEREVSTCRQRPSRRVSVWRGRCVSADAHKKVKKILFPPPIVIAISLECNQSEKGYRTRVATGELARISADVHRGYLKKFQPGRR